MSRQREAGEHNVMESCHRQLRKVTKGKTIFPHDESLVKMHDLSTMDVMKKWATVFKVGVQSYFSYPFVSRKE